MTHTSAAAAHTDFTDAASTAAIMHARCRAAGLDPVSYSGLAGVALTLGHEEIASWAVPWPADRDLVSAVVGLEHELRGRAARLTTFQSKIAASYRHAQEQAHAEANASGGMSDATRAWLADCLNAETIVQSGLARLRYARRRLSAIPTELGERYEAIYRFVNQGHVLPVNGRWLTEAGS
ncbi:hypothetical protein FXF51_06290 [Nonomuraea sp. PA05]|uniref:hypothetical protein n=1 Tax=Nonomuraea sp. PA05 TaxID=2604466 RepID=UPI0011DB182F|nr:hypothetical protein [Nonomuraea sp. PA05]TYB69770.1 hypothetical protein FXF51_06290 [Nonomuraea sp. PA05]